MDALILRILKTQSATIPEVAELCQTSEEAVRHRLHHLEKSGFSFAVHPALGITLSRTPARLIGDLILSAIPEQRTPQSITVYQSTRSTNDLAHQAGLNGAPCPAVFIAEQQTAGRGRNGRAWSSTQGLGIWMSILLRPTHPQHVWPRLTTATATLIANALRSTLSLPVQVKWPNDLWIGGAKLGGIIAETGTSPAGAYAVVGIGINVLHVISDFPPEIRSSATSIKLQLASEPCRNAVAASLLNSLSQIDYALSDEEFARILEQSRNLSCVLNHTIELSLNGDRVSGRAIGLNPEGHLILQSADGSERILHSGEVTHIRPSSC
jgi:BirA family biotin operon repressor/biotin-[acetyl-CoA-carboxylase] ligase